MDILDMKKYLDIAVKHTYWVIIPILVVLLAGFYYILKTPKIYESSTLILVQAQKVPENYVRSTVTISVQDRLRTITQQVTSRTNLEKIIQEQQLYESRSEKDLLMEEKIELLKKQIVITVANQSGNESAFSIAFQGENPNKVMLVTNALVSNFISENLKIRESQAFGTSNFLINELESVKKKLIEKEEQLKAYKEKYMGGLPEQLDANLKMLDRLQQQLDQLTTKVTTAEDKLAALQQPIVPTVQVNTVSSGYTIPIKSGDGDQLTVLKNELATMQTKYTDNHPDIIQLKNKIAMLEKSQLEQEDLITGKMPSSVPSQQTLPTQTGVNKKSRAQDLEIKNEIARLKSEIKETEASIDWYQTKVRDTPTRAQEMLSLNRDYNNLNAQYNTLLNKELDSELSLSMEKTQQGEQFKIIDPAKVPIKPIKPNVQKLSFMIIAIALGAGFGLAYLVDSIDTSYNRSEEIENELKIPVLITMPLIYTRKEIIRNKRKKILTVAALSMGFIFSVVAIIITVKGLDVTIGYLRSILEKI
jgi:polysaccharide chain length determinant protein (PEP-CTERM system associated)